MSSNCSSPSPPANSSLKALPATLSEAPEVREEMEVDSSTSATANIRTGCGLDLSAFQNNTALQTIISSALLCSNPPVKQEPVDQPSTSTPVLDVSALCNNPAFQAFFANKLATDGAKVAVPNLSATHSVKTERFSPVYDSPKKSRMKVYCNGYFMTFDKVSSCQKKHFWRCEYKNTCKARMHTGVMTVDHSLPHDPMQWKFANPHILHGHSHPLPSDDELRHYELIPEKLEPNKVYLVQNIGDQAERRRIRKIAADKEVARKKMEEELQRKEQSKQADAAIAAARAAVAQVSGPSIQQPCTSTAAAVSLLQTAGGMVSGTAPSTTQAHQLLQQFQLLQNGAPTLVKTEAAAPPAYPSPSLSATSSVSQPNSLLGIAPSTTNGRDSAPLRNGAVKRRQTDTPENHNGYTNDPLFEPTFEIARKLRKLWKGEPNRYPRSTAAPTRYFEFYVSRNDGFEEHLYVPVRIEQRDEAHLKEALQQFCGQQCIGILLFSVSPKISVMFNQPMISNWENNQFFLLDNSDPARWRLKFVDDRTM